MKLRSSKLIALSAAGGASLALAQAVQAATILTGLTSTNDAVPADHGSNAPGTPNIGVTWDAAWDQYGGWPNDPGGGVYQHDNGLNLPHTIVFTPGAGWNVALTALDLNVWAGGGDTDVTWTVVGSLSGQLGTGTFSTPNGQALTHNLGITAVNSETVTLSLTQTSGDASYLAVDNISFDQIAVPEPAGGVLGAIGLGALAMRRRRK